MKRIGLFLFASFLFASAFAQDEAETEDAPPGVFSSSPFSSTAARAPYCSKCYKRHYHSCSTTPPPSTPASVPIDGGLSVLLIAGAAYGAKRIRNKKSTSY